MNRRNQTLAIPAVAVAMLVLMTLGAQIITKASDGGIALFGLAICTAGLGLACVLTHLVEW